jgi:hypothetical protein
MSAGDVSGWSDAQHDDDYESPSSVSPTPPMRGSFALENGVQHNDAVVVGKIVSPSPQLPCRRTNPQQHVANGGGATAAAVTTSIIQSDLIPRKLRRSASVQARWEEKTSHLGAVPGRRCDPQHANRAMNPPDLPEKLKGSPLFPVIEVAPGIELRLRGSQETWEAIARDFYLPGLCWECSETTYVIQDAAYLLCPSCRTVSPMDGTFEHPHVSGVGLGFTFEELVLWQQQIADERNRNLYN